MNPCGVGMVVDGRTATSCWVESDKLGFDSAGLEIFFFARMCGFCGGNWSLRVI